MLSLILIPGVSPIRQALIVGYAIGMGVSLVLGQSAIAAMFMVGFHYELIQAQIAKLRREIRAKPMWNEGGFE